LNLIKKLRYRIFWFLCRHNLLFRLLSPLVGKHSFSVKKIDLIIASLFKDKPGPKYYIEIGANDGITQSNTKYLELYDGWSGSLIEPVPELYFKLLRNRSKLNSFTNAACCSFENSKPYFRLQYGNLRTISLDGDNDIENPLHHATNNSRITSEIEETYQFLAPAKTLNSILIEDSAPKLINFFSLDVEGAELEVLAGIDFKEYVFELICIESRSFERIESFLLEKGYIYVCELNNHVSYSDYLFRNLNFKLNLSGTSNTLKNENPFPYL
jgi:FkbM family methyltransferase